MRRSLLAFLVVNLGIVRSASAQVTPDDKDAESVNGSYSWIEWWECNRDFYMNKAIKPAADPQHANPLDAVLAKVVPALLEATHSPSVEVRAEAALALARIGKGEDRMLELTHDKELRVRVRAWVGLGLLQNEKALLEPSNLSDAEALAIIAGLGMLDAPGDGAWARIRESAAGARCFEVQRMALWALREYHTVQHIDDADDNALLLKIARTCTNFLIFSETLNDMGTIGRRANLPALADVAALGKQAMALPAINQIDPNDVNAKGRFIEIAVMRGAACLALAPPEKTGDGDNQPAPAASGATDPNLVREQNIFRTLAFKYLWEDAGRVGNNIFSKINLIYPGASVLALPAVDQTPLLSTLVTSDRPWATGLTVQAPDRVGHLPLGKGLYLPQRGYAAMMIAACGGDMVALRTIAINPGEPRHMRAAAILGLGLSGDQGNAQTIVLIADRLNPSVDSLLCGHVVLALGLLHDRRALEYAAKFGGVGARSIDVEHVIHSDFETSIPFPLQPRVPAISEMDDVMGARAALDGVGLLRDARAGPLLLANWGHNPWISLEAAKAMGQCGVYDGVDALLALLKQPKNPLTACWAARSLGEMLDSSSPSRLSRFIIGSCFVEPVQSYPAWLYLSPKADQTEREFQGLANPLLYWEIHVRPNGNGVQGMN